MRCPVPLACLAFFSGYGSSVYLPVRARKIAFFLEALFVGRSVCFHRQLLLGMWLMPAFPYGKRTSCGGSGVGTWSGASHFTPSPTTTGCPSLARDEGAAALFSEGRTRESHPVISTGPIL